MKKKRANFNNNTDFSAVTNETMQKPEIWDQYIDFRSGEVRITNRAWARRLGQELETYANNKNSFKVCNFFYDRGMRHDEFYRLISIYSEELAGYHEMATEKIGERREMAGLRRNFDPGIVSRTAPFYCRDWREINKMEREEKKDMIRFNSEVNKAADEKKHTVFNIYCDSTPDTGIKEKSDEI